MSQETTKEFITENQIIERIFSLRGQNVMLDSDLAEMYGVDTKVLNQAVKRNILRFPEDFMFQLTSQEWEHLRSHFVTLDVPGRGKYPKYLPKAFTEQGVAMLSSVLRSETAILVNIQIIRVYIKMRRMLFDSRELWRKMEKIESDITKKDDEIKAIFKILKELIIKEQTPREAIGFKIPKKNSA